MSIVTEVETYEGVKCHPIILLFKSGVVTEFTGLPTTARTIEKLKEEGEEFTAIVMAVDDNLYQRTETRPLVNTLRLMPRELWYVSWLEIASIPEAIVAHRGIEGDDLKELYIIYDRIAKQHKRISPMAAGRLTHTVDIDLLIINPELWERFVQAEQEGA